MPPISDKPLIRKQALTDRNATSNVQRQQWSRAITQQLLQHPAYQSCQHILAYMNFGSEFMCDDFASSVLTAGKHLYLPKVNQQTRELDLFEVVDLKQQLQQGLWGIREPLVTSCSQLIDVNEVEFALLPGLAFTKSGARLGYGGGFYDKLLARMVPRPVLVAAAFELQIRPELPLEPTDVNVDWIITEQATIACSTQIEY